MKKYFFLIFIFYFGLISVLKGQIDNTKKNSKSCTPILLVDKFKGGDIIAKEDVAKLTKPLGAYYPCDKTTYPVVSYQFIAIVKGTSVVLKGVGNTLTTEMKVALGSVSSGSKIFFENVKAKGPGGSIVNVSGATFTMNIK